MSLEYVEPVITAIIFLAPSAVPACFFMFLALRHRDDVRYRYASLVSSSVSLLAIYEITIGAGSKDAQSAIGFVFIPFVSVFLGYLTFAISSVVFKNSIVNSNRKAGSSALVSYATVAVLVLMAILLFDTGRNSVFSNLAKSSSDLPTLLILTERARENDDQTIMLMLAQNPAAHTEVLKRLSQFAPDFVLIHITSNPNVSKEMLRDFAERPSVPALNKFAEEALSRRLNQ